MTAPIASPIPKPNGIMATATIAVDACAKANSAYVAATHRMPPTTCARAPMRRTSRPLAGRCRSRYWMRLSQTVSVDVTTPEPLPPDDPLLQAPNLIVVPHIGSATHATRARMTDLAVDNLLAGLAGRPLPHQVQ
jgi:hypothetical protein